MNTESELKSELLSNQFQRTDTEAFLASIMSLTFDKLTY